MFDFFFSKSEHFPSAYVVIGRIQIKFERQKGTE